MRHGALSKKENHTFYKDTPKRKQKKTKQKKNLSSHTTATTDSSLYDDLTLAKKDIDTILFHLSYQTEPDLIDACSYQLKSAYMRYKYYLQQIQKTTDELVS